MYGWKIMVSLTLCRFLDHTVEWEYIRAAAARRLCTLCWLEYEECHTWVW